MADPRPPLTELDVFTMRQICLGADILIAASGDLSTRLITRDEAKQHPHEQPPPPAEAASDNYAEGE